MIFYQIILGYLAFYVLNLVYFYVRPRLTKVEKIAIKEALALSVGGPLTTVLFILLECYFIGVWIIENKDEKF